MIRPPAERPYSGEGAATSRPPPLPSGCPLSRARDHGVDAGHVL